MIRRRKTRAVQVGSVRIGGGAPIVVQSMTKVSTTDVDLCVRQIRRLAAAGCGVVRLAVPRAADTAALARICRRVGVPLVADIHFSPERAIEAIEAGAAKIRLNPGNIKDRSAILRIIDSARAHGAAVRIGINEASIRDLRHDVPQARRIALMVREMKGYVRLFEGRGFHRLVLSVKSSDPVRTIEANRAIAEAFDYPIHLGLTHAGLPEDAQTPSAVALGTLLAEGIGDTIRVSVAGDPVVEARMAVEILQALGLRDRHHPEVVVCPTCGRTEIDLVRLARKVKKAVTSANKPIRVAVMGCVVNGPGEAADADLAVCAGRGKAFLYRHGQRVGTVPESRVLAALSQELAKL